MQADYKAGGVGRRGFSGGEMRDREGAPSSVGEDLERNPELSGGRVDVTVGSALDLFGGSGVGYEELVAWNRRGI